MRFPVMKGINVEGCPFIAIKVDCYLTVENIEKTGFCEHIKDPFEKNLKLEDIIVLSQLYPTGPLFGRRTGDGKFVWGESHDSRAISPSFFTESFTDAETGEGPNESQKNNFKLMQTLLQTGECLDQNGRIWKIPANILESPEGTYAST
jgi:hypothetical protein